MDAPERSGVAISPHDGTSQTLETLLATYTIIPASLVNAADWSSKESDGPELAG